MAYRSGVPGASTTVNDSDIVVCGDDLLSVGVADPQVAQRRAKLLRETGDWLEVVAGIDSVVVQFDAARIDTASAIDALEIGLAENVDAETEETTLIEIPVVYGGDNGPDLERLCGELGLSSDEFIALHTSDEYRVDMLGFTPGFAYVGGLDARLDVPRLPEPRTHVAAGSIGIAGGRTGIYSLPGPGGWPLIGRTTLALFDAAAEDPFLLAPGVRVRFVRVNEGDS